MPVALPALAVEEQRGALALAAQAWGGDRSGVEPGDAAQASQEDASAARGRVELSFAPLSAAPASRRAPGPALFDGDREAVARPHAAAELPHAGLEVSSLLVHAAPAAAEGGAARRELWLAGEGKVYRVEASEVAPHTPWEIAIPEELRGACLAVVQGGVPWIAEVTGLGVEEHLSGLGAAALASRLGGQAGELAARALLAQGPDALGDLLAALRELSPQGRRRARQIAAVWGDDALAQVVVRQLMAGDELEQEGARSVLRELDASGRAALVSALGQARPREEVALASALAELAPDQAGGHLVQLLDHPSPARRLEIRRVLAGLAGRPQAQRHLGALLLDGSRTRRSRTELLRALTPFVDRLDASARGQAFAFLQTAGFHEAYRLVPVLLELSRTDPKAAQLGVERFVQNGAGYSALQRAALRRHLLQVGTDAEAPLPWLSPQAISLLTNSQVRVRRAAADYLAKFPVPAAAEVLIGRTRDDEWPEVRQRTVRALGVLRGRAEEKVEQTVLWSLRKDAEPVVRAAAARALDDMPTEATLSVLRRSLQKDESTIVRAEVARSLGQVCDRASLDALTRLANGLRQGAREEADVRVGLAAAAAVARMAPDEVEERLEPLFRSDVPGVLRARVEAAIEPGLGQCATESRQ